MRFCDLTFAYTASSGGIRTYIDQKRSYLLTHTDHEHVLIIPDRETSVEREGRATTIRLASPLIPGCEPYRFFRKPRALMEALREAEPDVIELGSFFLEPWVAFRFRKEQRARGKSCTVGGYFHTDLAGAYFGEPVRRALGANVESRSEILAGIGTKVGDFVEAGAEVYFGAVFKRCDQMFAASAVQAERLTGYGVTSARQVPLGVDVARFCPARRSRHVRALYGAGDDTLVLVYAGRLDREKRVQMLVEAFKRLNLPNAKLLMLGEGPARAELESQARTMRGLSVLHHERNPDVLAGLLASADIYVTAGPHETFGLSVIEAQASGLPVVGVRAGALIERVPAGTGLLGPVDDAEAMARNIEEIARQRETWSQAARRHVESGGFSWDATFSTLLNAYEMSGEMARFSARLAVVK